MLVSILAIGIFIIGILLLIYSEYNSFCSSWVLGTGIVSTVMGTFGIVLASVCLILAQGNKDIDYQNTLYEKEVLEYRLECLEENNVGNELLYNDIVEFNNNLRNVKKWANNPWVNWFYNQDIATIDYVDLKGD